jgi:hypothetical protein
MNNSNKNDMPRESKLLNVSRMHLRTPTRVEGAKGKEEFVGPTDNPRRPLVEPRRLTCDTFKSSKSVFVIHFESWNIISVKIHVGMVSSLFL